MDDVPPPFGLISTGDCGNEEGCWRWMGWVDRRFWSFSFVSMVRLERQDAVPTLERGNDQNLPCFRTAGNDRSIGFAGVAGFYRMHASSQGGSGPCPRW